MPKCGCDRRAAEVVCGGDLGNPPSRATALQVSSPARQSVISVSSAARHLHPSCPWRSGAGVVALLLVSVAR
jgi:hypothetical protein